MGYTTLENMPKPIGRTNSGEEIFVIGGEVDGTRRGFTSNPQNTFTPITYISESPRSVMIAEFWETNEGKKGYYFHYGNRSVFEETGHGDLSRPELFKLIRDMLDVDRGRAAAEIVFHSMKKNPANFRNESWIISYTVYEYLGDLQKES